MMVTSFHSGRKRGKWFKKRNRIYGQEYTEDFWVEKVIQYWNWKLILSRQCSVQMFDSRLSRNVEWGGGILPLGTETPFPCVACL